jgi:hypothetical protein
MIKKSFLFFAAVALITACNQSKQTPENMEKAEKMSIIDSQNVALTIDSLVKAYGEPLKVRISKGVKQAAAFWTEKDGDVKSFTLFCQQNFIANDSALEVAFDKLQRNYEVLYGNFNKMGLDLRIPLDVQGPDITTVDQMFGSYDPSAHLKDDFFNNKIAFLVLLNFPHYSLKEKMELGTQWNRKEWAYARVGDIYSSRVPADVLLKITETQTLADMYISEYNICMGNLVDNENKNLFPKDMKLISHWGLRDELKAQYSAADGLPRQRMIYEVMKHIIKQDIPKEVINNESLNWNPLTNKVFTGVKETASNPEPDTRYEYLLKNFKAVKAADAWSPMYPNYISRKFDEEMEIPQEEVEKLFTEYLSSPLVKQVATLIAKRLGRPLEPFDIWYDGFKSRSSINIDVLEAKVKSKYQSKEALEKQLPGILQTLGFTPGKASDICEYVQVDAARGAGHAAGAAMKTDKARLRSRFPKEGMNYKGYNIAMHEFGHNVEQTITLHDVDYYMLSGVPNTSFTEALAFMFQRRDLQMLGMEKTDANAESLMALDVFWSNYEIMGVSLVDMAVWKWLYANPDATAAQLKEAVVRIANEIWNKYYADVFGVKDQPILAIYSHMIDYPLYLSAYPIGHLIDFQLEQQVRGKNFASEILRIYPNGRLVPELWMKKATGQGISNKPVFEATEKALKDLK